MSNELIARSPALQRLRNEGYNLSVEYGYIVMRDVPYVNAAKQVHRGVLVSALQSDGTTAANSGINHVMQFAGEYPCDTAGQPLEGIRNNSLRQVLHDPDLVVDHLFSAKPESLTYPDYYEKFTTYLELIAGPARVVDPSKSAKTWPTFLDSRKEAPFKYIDSASSRAKITALTQRLENQVIAIIGLGGTGSYVLDLVAKTPVREIRLFDGDCFSPHNAFRSPGAASVEELAQRPSKVAYLHATYSKMRNRLFAHQEYVGPGSADSLAGVTMAFVCVDKNSARREIIELLERMGIAFIDCGMGVEVINEALSATVRATTSTPQKRDHVRSNGRLDLSDDATMDDEYATNIQIADLNMLNAAMAVIKWKKLTAFYLDYEQEHHSTYTVEENMLSGGDQS